VRGNKKYEAKMHTAIENEIRYSFPPEWAPQSGIMLTWPHNQTIWAETLQAIDQVFVEVAQHVTLREKLIISCFDEEHRTHIKNLLTAAGVNLNMAAIYIAPCDDVWVRDHGPLSVFHQDKPVLLDFIFNGWGDKYPSANDNNITRTLHAQQAFGGTALKSVDMVLEGGAIEVDGNGTLLTTSSCLLAKSRNPGLSQIDIAERMHELLGIKRILWLDHGALAGDDTDGHIDTLARFIDSDTICYITCPDPTDEHYTPLKEMERQLCSFTNYLGKPYTLIPLPWPQVRYADYDGRRLPATYANFLLINGAVLVPTYSDPADAEALRIFECCFPDRKIIGIHCLPVIQWYGSLHCMTMQLPVGVL